MSEPCVWITGARGFIGRHVARHASQQGQRVAGLGYGAWPDSEAAEWGIGLWTNGEVSQANLDRLAGLTGAPRAIIHLAGGSSVGMSFQTPAEDFRRSVESTASILEWTRVHAPRTRLVLSSSAAVYGNGHSEPINEAARPQPFSPYGYHKRIAELLCESYSRASDQQITVVRLFSVYGPGLRKQLLWDLCVRQEARPDSITLAGTGTERRDLLHVADAASYIYRAATVTLPGWLLVNGGTGVGVTIAEIAEAVVTAWGATTPVKFSAVRRPGDPEYLVADVNLAAAFGWSPTVKWRDGVREYVSWYRSRGESMAV